MGTRAFLRYRAFCWSRSTVGTEQKKNSTNMRESWGQIVGLRVGEGRHLKKAIETWMRMRKNCYSLNGVIGNTVSLSFYPKILRYSTNNRFYERDSRLILDFFEDGYNWQLILIIAMLILTRKWGTFWRMKPLNFVLYLQANVQNSYILVRRAKLCSSTNCTFVHLRTVN